MFGLRSFSVATFRPEDVGNARVDIDHDCVSVAEASPLTASNQLQVVVEKVVYDAQLPKHGAIFWP